MDYKESLNLPKTDFPMKANLAAREPEMLARWEEMKIYHRIRAVSKGREVYILHDGPPYANGSIHLGTALNKIIKDMVIKAKNMSGYDSIYVPGWDCHGLPIEHQVDKELGDKKYEISQADKRRFCRRYAERFVDIQREQFKRLGVFGEWENPYLTMTYDYEAITVAEFGKLYLGGDVYKGKKPVYWCATCKTALAEAEVEYGDHTTPSIYVKFPMISDIAAVRPKLAGEKVSVVIWTTTPWTIPANLAIAFHEEFLYVAVKIEGEVLILAKDLLDYCLDAFGWQGKPYEILDEFPGAVMEGLKTRHPLIDRESVLILAPFVTLDAGTGCVHIAPGHGQEDYEIGMKYGLDNYAPVDEDGRFTKDVADFAGMFVFDANDPVNKKLKEVGRSWAWWTSSIPTPTVGAARNPSSSVPRSSGSSPWKRTASVKRPWRPSPRANGSPPGGRTGSTAWWRTGPTGVFPVSASGASPSPCSTVRNARVNFSPKRFSTTWWPWYGNTAPTSGSSGRRRISCPRARSVRYASKAGNSGRKRTSSTCGSTRASAMPPSWRPVPITATPRTCIWKEATSTGAGSTLRSWSA